MLGRYQVEVVSDDATQRAVQEVAEQVRHRELNRATDRQPLESRSFAGRQVEAVLFACRDRATRRVVGCVRGTHATALRSIPESRRAYGFDVVPPSLLDRAGVATRLAVLPDYRRTGAGLALMDAMYAESLRRGYGLCLLSCEPGLFAVYRRLGFRPLGPLHEGPDGVRVPMVLVLHDREHLRRIRSPLARTLARSGVACPGEAAAWYRSWSSRPDFEVGVEPYAPTPSFTSPVLEGLSPEGLVGLFKNAMRVRCHDGQRIIAAHDGCHALGLLERGAAEVVSSTGAATQELRPGDPIGEISHVLGQRRAADVVARGPDTRVILLSRNAGRRLQPHDQAVLWHNLARGLAERLVERAP